MSPVPAVPVKNTRNAAAQINSTKEPRGTKTSGLCFLYGNKETGEVEEMNYEIDVHTHTIASGHAYSTLQEMVRAAKEKGLKNFVLGGGYGADDGIFQYKTCLAPKGIVDFYIGRKVFDGENYKKLVDIRTEENPGCLESGYFPKYRA